jgi:hypothetical protein
MTVSAIMIMIVAVAATQLPGARPERDRECGFEGNSDLYGLGIRLGIYMQWLSALIVYGWYPDGRQSLNETYIIFLFAVIVVIIVQTLQVTRTYAIEILILNYIIFGGAYTVLITGVRRRHLDRKKRLSQLQLLSVVSILCACSGYCWWFWDHGVHDDNNFLATPCDTYTMFLFAKVSFYNDLIINGFSALSMLGSLGFGFLILQLTAFRALLNYCVGPGQGGFVFIWLSNIYRRSPR